MKDFHVSLIGVPTNSSGTVNGVANAPEALRHARILEALGNLYEINDQGNVAFSSP